MCRSSSSTGSTIAASASPAAPSAGHLCGLAPVAARAGADAVAAARGHAAHTRRGLGERRPGWSRGASLARTIAFNAEHVFVSRRLVRMLKGKGRLAVYLPDAVEPDVKAFRLFRAVARIAMQADARIVPIFVGGARHLPFSLTPAGQGAAPLVPAAVRISVLEPMTIAELAERAERGQDDRRQRAVRPPRRGAALRQPTSTRKPVPGDARRGDRFRAVAADHRGRGQRRAELPQAVHRRARARPAASRT